MRTDGWAHASTAVAHASRMEETAISGNWRRPQSRTISSRSTWDVPPGIRELSLSSQYRCMCLRIYPLFFTQHYTYIHTYIHKHIHMNIYVYIYTYVCVDIHIYIHSCIYIYAYNIYNSIFSMYIHRHILMQTYTILCFLASLMQLVLREQNAITYSYISMLIRGSS